MQTTAEAIKAEAACSEPQYQVRRIDKPEETAIAGRQFGEQKLKGDNVIVTLVEEHHLDWSVEREVARFDEFLKQNGYETIPEKEEEPK